MEALDVCFGRSQRRQPGVALFVIDLYRINCNNP